MGLLARGDKAAQGALREKAKPRWLDDGALSAHDTIWPGTETLRAGRCKHPGAVFVWLCVCVCLRLSATASAVCCSLRGNQNDLGGHDIHE